MLHYNPFQIGVIACPGGEAFAKKIISHLKVITIKKYKKRIHCLAKKFSTPETVLKEQVKLLRGISASEGISTRLGAPDYEIKANFVKFANGEFKTELLSSIRGKDIYIIQDVENHQPLSFYKSDDKSVLSVNDHIFCMYVTIDAALQAGAKRVTVVMPAYPYSRQHKKQKREGLTAARFGQMSEYLGVARIITLDIHSKEIENCFNQCRLENLHASYQIMKVLKDLTNLKDPDFVVVSPDTGAVDRNKFFAESLQTPLAMLYKERDYSVVSQSASQNNIKNMRLLGDVKGKTVFMCDDMLGTGGTLIKAMRFLKEMGAKKIFCGISLPLFNGNAISYFDEAFSEGLFDQIIGTDAVYHNDELLHKEWYTAASVSKLFAKSIYRLHNNLNLSSILDNRKIINRLLSDSEDSKEENGRC